MNQRSWWKYSLIEHLLSEVANITMITSYEGGGGVRADQMRVLTISSPGFAESIKSQSKMTSL